MYPRHKLQVHIRSSRLFTHLRTENVLRRPIGRQHDRQLLHACFKVKKPPQLFTCPTVESIV